MVNIISLLEMFETDSLQGTNADVYDKIDQSVNRLNNTLNDLIEIVSSKKLSAKQKEVVPLYDNLLQTLTSFEPQINQARASLVVDIHPEDTLYINKNILENILFNLVSNAIKYRSPERSLKIRISTLNTDSYYCLTVTDNGMGMDLGRIGAKLFGLYQRFHPAVEGKGIGLYIIKNQIDSFGGKIEVESKEKTGTTFRVYFPKV